MRKSTVMLLVALPAATMSFASDRYSIGKLTCSTRRNSSVLADASGRSMKNRKRRIPGAPLVDSTLLRFVSEQKKKRADQLIEKEKDSNIDARLGSPPSLAIDDGSSSSSLTSTDTDMQQSPSTAAVEGGGPWMGKFNRNRIAKSLVDLGVNEKAALEAGIRVQSYVLARTARRRIRVFLKQRDTQWNNELTTESPSLAGTSEYATLLSDPTHPNYEMEDIFMVMSKAGLTGLDICATLTHSPGLALMLPTKELLDNSERGESETSKSRRGETLEETLDRSFTQLLRTTLQMRKYAARKVIRECPGLLTMRGSKSAVQVVAMMSELGVSTNAIARDVVSLPALLSRPPAGLFRLISFLSGDLIRMPINMIGPMLRRRNSRDLLNAAIPIPRMELSKQRGAIAASFESVESVLDRGEARERRVQTVNAVYENMTATAKVLKDEIGARNLHKVVTAFPTVFLLDVETQILPVAEYIFDEICNDRSDLGIALEQYPTLLERNVDDIRTSVNHLVSIGVDPQSLGTIVRAFPALLTITPEETIPVVEFLESVGIKDVGAFITLLPPILRYSVEKELRPKWEYLQKVALQPKYELTRFPAYFSYPFEKVIQTRYEYLARKEISRQLIPVDAILRFGDNDFATKIVRDTDGGAEFRAFATKRKSALKPKLRKLKKPKKGKLRA